MGNSRHYKMRLTNRDKELLKYLFITKGATRWQIHRDVFAGLSRQVVHERLRKLSKYGFIKGIPSWFEGARTAYQLTHKILGKCDLFGVEPKRLELRSANSDHEFSLVEVRKQFLRAKGLVHYLTENELQSGLFGSKVFNYDAFIECHSDAFLRINLTGGEFSGAIEFEQSAKSRSRYNDLFLKYYCSSNVVFVFYITSSESLRSSIFKVDKEVRSDRSSKIFAVTYQEMKQAKDFFVLKDADNHILKIHLQQEKFP